MGLRYVHAEPREKRADSLDLRLDENHKPPVYLATVRLLAGRPNVADTEHVLDVAAPVLARPASFAEDDLSFERGRELVTTTLAPCERAVYHVAWRSERALSFWFADGV